MVYQSSWLGTSMYELVHPDDGLKLREHLVTSANIQSPSCVSSAGLAGAGATSSGGNNSVSGRILDLKSGTVKKEVSQS